MCFASSNAGDRGTRLPNSKGGHEYVGQPSLVIKKLACSANGDLWTQTIIHKNTEIKTR